MARSGEALQDRAARIVALRSSPQPRGQIAGFEFGDFISGHPALQERNLTQQLVQFCSGHICKDDNSAVSWHFLTSCDDDVCLSVLCQKSPVRLSRTVVQLVI